MGTTLWKNKKRLFFVEEITFPLPFHAINPYIHEEIDYTFSTFRSRRNFTSILGGEL
jgi:hypothetical protein